MGPTCHNLINIVLLSLLLDENTGADRYVLLAVLVFQQKHISLVNYSNLLLLDEIPVISFSSVELRYEERHFKNFVSFKVYKRFITKFLFHFLRKENIQSLIILHTGSTFANDTISDIKARLEEEKTSVCRSEIYDIKGTNNETELILERIRENTFTKFIVLVSNNKIAESVIHSLAQSKIRKIVFLYGKNLNYLQPDGNVENIVLIKGINIGFEFFANYLFNAIGKTSDVLESLNASSFNSRRAPKNVSMIFATSLREEGSSKNTRLKMIYKEKGMNNTLKEYGLYTIDGIDGNEKLHWHSNATSWNETFYHSEYCQAGFYPIYKGADKCRWICVFCESGYYKKVTEQNKCSMSNRNTFVTNLNRIKCLPFVHQHYQVNRKCKSIVQLLATVGFLYSLSFLAIFLEYRITPVVKSSNIPLTPTQIIYILAKAVSYFCR